ncbi:unnamed protein product [Prorocentrum cordatum]|uniref:Peptidase A1 domain-containing protein n=1 Tax=Prorocentrum cordatum TaxID=2364126 RepID=A0ABN9URE1_9DINO|nr:unnamed protein product [Polarella glacialis]
MSSVTSTGATRSPVRRSCSLFGIATISCSMGFLIPVSAALSTPTKDATSVAPVGLISLRRESVPVQRKGQVVAFKTSYSGTIHVGSPEPQEFRVVFDTGSGHVVLPSVKCSSAVCLQHRRFDATASASSAVVNTDGSLVSEGAEGDRVTIGYGTGKVTGELVRERVCLGPAAQTLPRGEANSSGPAVDVARAATTCATVHTVAATELSANPFSLFSFDGIVGLGLRDLSLSREFNFLDLLGRSGGAASSSFGIFLSEGHDGEESELAVGGHNPERLLSPLTWSPAIRPELGYWQVQVKAVHIGDHFTLPLCQDTGDGSCRGVIDTGTSHLGVPAPHLKTLQEMLTVAVTDTQDRLSGCRGARHQDRAARVQSHPHARRLHEAAAPARGRGRGLLAGHGGSAAEPGGTGLGRFAAQRGRVRSALPAQAHARPLAGAHRAQRLHPRRARAPPLLHRLRLGRSAHRLRPRQLEAAGGGAPRRRRRGGGRRAPLAVRPSPSAAARGDLVRQRAESRVERSFLVPPLRGAGANPIYNQRLPTPCSCRLPPANGYPIALPHQGLPPSRAEDRQGGGSRGRGRHADRAAPPLAVGSGRLARACGISCRAAEASLSRDPWREDTGSLARELLSKGVSLPWAPTASRAG